MSLETSTFETDAWSADTMARELRDPNCVYLVAFPPGAPELIEGYAGLLAPEGAQQGDIQTIAVAPGARGHGLGRTLVLSLVSAARRRGAREIFLEVRDDNPGARRLYERLGFVELGVRRGYYQPGNVDAIVMRLHIPAPEFDLADATPEVTG